MKIKTMVLVVLACYGSVLPASASEKIRTVADIRAIPKRVLERTLSKTIYRELLVSPVEGWIQVRGQLSGTHVFGARIIHSELDGAYDKYALKLARDWQMSGHFGTGNLNPTTRVVLNVLIYEIADGIMAVSFPAFDEPGGAQLEYYGGAKLAVQKINGEWADLKLPEGPLGKVWAVRAGPANNFALEMKLQQIAHGRGR